MGEGVGERNWIVAKRNPARAAGPERAVKGRQANVEFKFGDQSPSYPSHHVEPVSAKACLGESVLKPACVNRFQKLLDHGQAGSNPQKKGCRLIGSWLALHDNQKHHTDNGKHSECLFLPIPHFRLPHQKPFAVDIEERHQSHQQARRQRIHVSAITATSSTPSPTLSQDSAAEKSHTGSIR